MVKPTLITSVIFTLTGPAAALLPTSANQAQLHPIVAPTARPNVTETDPWTCVTESVREIYFDPPKPTGALDSALISYGDKLIETCLTSGTYRYPCDFPDKTRWCGVTTALPSSLLPAYSSYASNASSWWSVHSSAAVRVAQECPIMWWEMGNMVVLGGAVQMNLTLINAECYAEAHATGVRSSTTTGPTATPRQGVTGSSSAPTRTAQNGVTGRGESGQRWAVAAAPGLAAAWANGAL
jgi:hypothetical protein